jgi:plastocyanin
MRRFSTLLALLGALTMVASACSTTTDTGFGPTPTPTTEESPSGEDASTLEDPAEYTEPIDVGDNFFAPRFVTAEAGDIEWAQTGAAPHTVTADDGSYDSHPDCTFQATSECMNQGDDFTQAFDEPGEYPYYCKLHGAPGGVGMAGVVIIT